MFFIWLKLVHQSKQWGNNMAAVKHPREKKKEKEEASDSPLNPVQPEH